MQTKRGQFKEKMLTEMANQDIIIYQGFHFFSLVIQIHLQETICDAQAKELTGSTFPIW